MNKPEQPPSGAGLLSVHELVGCEAVEEECIAAICRRARRVHARKEMSRRTGDKNAAESPKSRSRQVRQMGVATVLTTLRGWVPKIFSTSSIRSPACQGMALRCFEAVLNNAVDCSVCGRDRGCN